MCSGFKCADQHHYVLNNDLFSKMSRVTSVIVLLWVIIMSAFYTHHPNVSTTYTHLFMSTHISNMLLITDKMNW